MIIERPVRYVKEHGAKWQYLAARRAAQRGDGVTVKSIAQNVYRKVSR